MGRSRMIIRLFRPDQTSDGNLITFEFENDTFSLVNALIVPFPLRFTAGCGLFELK